MYRVAYPTIQKKRESVVCISPVDLRYCRSLRGLTGPASILSLVIKANVLVTLGLLVYRQRGPVGFLKTCVGASSVSIRVVRNMGCFPCLPSTCSVRCKIRGKKESRTSGIKGRGNPIREPGSQSADILRVHRVTATRTRKTNSWPSVTDSGRFFVVLRGDCAAALDHLAEDDEATLFTDGNNVARVLLFDGCGYFLCYCEV